MKLINFLKSTFNDSKFVETKLQKEFIEKDYAEKVILKNSAKLNYQLLLLFLFIDIYLLYNIKTYSHKILIIIFCLVTLILPLTKIINQKPKLIISKDNLTFKDGKHIKWSQIESTIIEELDSSEISSYYKLNVKLKNNETIKIRLSDLNYSKSEISHIIEYYKQNNGC
ncbi:MULTISPECIES: hypothetical protein [Flavobacterium]|uniref:YcxB-like protein n=1 Tax=Flavobacterium jumunjinense TaxID=998845 RepID=A0ABV5GPS0_9FLAO|nr:MULTISPECIES: hypothetical protein [Flavobacterium]